LVGADLRNANLAEAILRGADLTRAQVNLQTVRGADFSEALGVPGHRH
jgi:uncharacterized protein YjbI with pentapeptide repeats